MAENPNLSHLSPPPCDFSLDKRRSALQPSSIDSAEPESEVPRRPLTSMTIERGGVAGGVTCPDLPAADSSLSLPSPLYWPFTPLPTPSPAESDESFNLPDLPSWFPQPLPCNSSESYVEETPGIWAQEAEPVVKKRKVEAGRMSVKSSAEVAAGDDGGLSMVEMVEIAKLRGWQGRMDRDTFWLINRLMPIFFRPPYVRSFLSLSSDLNMNSLAELGIANDEALGFYDA